VLQHFDNWGNQIETGQHGGYPYMYVTRRIVFHVVQPSRNGLKIIYDGGDQLYQFDAAIRQLKIPSTYFFFDPKFI